MESPTEAVQRNPWRVSADSPATPGLNQKEYIIFIGIDL